MQARKEPSKKEDSPVRLTDCTYVGRGKRGGKGGRALDDGLELGEEKRDWTWMMMTTVVLMVARPRTERTWGGSGGRLLGVGRILTLF